MISKIRSNSSRVIFVLLSVVFTFYSSLSVKPNQDDLAIFSTGINLLQHGSYTEYFFEHSHRGPLGAVIHAAAYFLIDDFVWARNIVAGISSALCAAFLVLIAREINVGSTQLTIGVFLFFPFVPYLLNQSAIHLLQVASLLSVFLFAQRITFDSKPTTAWLFGISSAIAVLIYMQNVLIIAMVSAAVLTSLFVNARVDRLVSLIRNGLRILTPIVIAFGIQTGLVYFTSGKIALSNESFTVTSTWNLLHPPDPSIPPATYEELTQEPAPKSPTELLTAMSRHRAMFLDRYIKPSFRGLFNQTAHIEFRFFLIPFFLLGVLSVRPNATRLLYLGIVIAAMTPILYVNIFVYGPRYLAFGIIAMVPFIASGIEYLCRWVGDAATLSTSSEPRSRIVGYSLVLVPLSLFLLGMNVKELRAGNNDQASVIFDFAEYLTSDSAPPPGADVLTTTGKFYLWRPDIEWHGIGEFDRDIVDSLRDSGRDVYAVVESQKAHSVLPALVEIYDGTGVEQFDLKIGELFGDYVVEALAIRGEYQIWMLRLQTRM